jgi:hypothetical protein
LTKRYRPVEEIQADVLALAKKTCSLELGQLLREQGGFLLVDDGRGPKWLSAQDVLAAARPIDTPAKALLAVWVTDKYTLWWNDGKKSYGSDEDGRVRKVAGGFEVVGATLAYEGECGANAIQYRHTLFVDPNGNVSEREKVATDRYHVTDACHPHGRRPADFVDVASGDTVRGYFVRALHHEAESVRAFERIARELRAHDAPEELWRAAEQAAIEEREHATRCAQLAGVPLAIASDALGVRGLVEIAIDNAREGCVGEAYGALAAVVQAQTARDEAVRAHFAAIAADEVAHAALAYAIAEWVEVRLTRAERTRVRDERAAAVRELASSLPMSARERDRELGVPTGSIAGELLRRVAALGVS